jgi:hypothetical protein
MVAAGSRYGGRRYADTIRDDYIDAAETVAATVARPFLPRDKDALKLLIGA